MADSLLDRVAMRPGLIAAPLLLSALVAASHLIASTASPPAASQRGSAFQSGIDLVMLNVTVTDQEHRFVNVLSQNDFEVFEDGVKQDISFFAGEQVPLDLAIVLDSSSSMAPVWSTAKNAAIRLAQTARAGDQLMVMTISGQANMVQPLTADTDGAIAALRAATTRGSTALYTTLYLAVSEMMNARRTQPDVRRQAIAVLSDGLDTASLVEYDALMERVKESNITIYSIALSEESNTQQPLTVRMEYPQPLFIMKSFAQETGGRYFLTHNANELDRMYGEIADELGKQYTIGYSPKNLTRDGGFRRVSVRVLHRDDVSVRTRTGYQAPRSHPSRAER